MDLPFHHLDLTLRKLGREINPPGLILVAEYFNKFVVGESTMLAES